MSPKELNQQLLFGIRKHLMIAQDTTVTKVVRNQSLEKLGVILDYIHENMNEAVDPSEFAIYEIFFTKLAARVAIAKMEIARGPVWFGNEIGFMNVMMTPTEIVK
jgi:hypothetical protein